jgi:hypothetical protein
MPGEINYSDRMSFRMIGNGGASVKYRAARILVANGCLMFTGY